MPGKPPAWKQPIEPEGIETGNAQVALIADLPTGGRLDADSKDALVIDR